VDPVPDPLLLRKSGSAGNRPRDLCFCIQELWPLDHRGGQGVLHEVLKEVTYKNTVAVTEVQFGDQHLVAARTAEWTCQGHRTDNPLYLFYLRCARSTFAGDQAMPSAVAWETMQQDSHQVTREDDRAGNRRANSRGFYKDGVKGHCGNHAPSQTKKK
jgi:hypothetical protein